MNIAQQKDLADKLLSQLYSISPYVMLAGGAPRDWYFGKEAQDLDIYLYSHAITVKTMQKQLKSATGVDFRHNWELQRDDTSLYTSMPQLRRVFEAEIDSMKVQVMQLNNPEDEFKVINNMSTSICKVWYQGDGEIHAHEDFKLTLASGVMFLNNGYDWTHPHPKKMRERYGKDFPPSTKEQAKQLVVSKALREINLDR